jgi:GT2 family glycosyltransferase
MNRRRGGVGPSGPGTARRGATIAPGPQIAVVIITRDRADELLHTLARLRELPERPQTVVVDQGSSDDSAARVRRSFPDVRVLRSRDDLGAAGRTAGVRAVAAPYVAFCDDDSWWAAGALERAGLLLDAHPGVALVAARVLVGEQEQLDPACAAMAASPLSTGPGQPGPRVLGFVACGAVVRRSAYLDVGGFRAALGVGGEEDLLATDLAAAGWDLVYCDALVAHHHPSPIRDRDRRRELEIRNRLWFAWLRRHHGAALSVTLAAARAAAREPSARAGLLSALSGARSILAQRSPVPAWLEADLRKLDAAS